MFVVIRGTISYCLSAGDNGIVRKRCMAADVRKSSRGVVRFGGSLDHGKDWLCEAALWTANWNHFGNALAEENCFVFAVDAARFGEVLLSTPSQLIRQTSKAYGE